MKTLLSSASLWREQLNPLRGLTIARAVHLLEAAQRGEFADVQWTYEFIESTDPTLLAIVERRTASLCEMDYRITKVPEDYRNFDPVLAEDQARALEEAYDRIDNLYAAIEHFETAVFRGYAHLNPRHTPDGHLHHLEVLDQWNLCRDGRYGAWYWNPEALDLPARSLGDAARLDKRDYFLHEVRRSIDRIALIKFVRSNLSEKDWDSYIEIYGIPACFIILPENVPSEKEDKYLNLAEQAAQGASGALPGGSTVTFPSEARGTQPFDLRLDWLNKQLVLAGTGGLLTMLTESGSGTLAGGAHSETFRMIARSRARKITEQFQNDIDKAVLTRAFPGRPRLAYFELASEEEQDTGAQVEQIAKLAPYYLIDPADVTERTGLKITGHREQNPQPFNPQPANPQLFAANRGSGGHPMPANLQAEMTEVKLLDTAADLALQAEREDLAPLAARIQSALDLLETADEEAAATALQDLRNQLADYAQPLLEEPRLADILDQALTAAALNGYAEAAAEHKQTAPEPRA